MWLKAAAFFVQIFSSQGTAFKNTSWIQTSAFLYLAKTINKSELKENASDTTYKNYPEKLTINFSLMGQQPCSAINFQNIGS